MTESKAPGLRKAAHGKRAAALHVLFVGAVFAITHSTAPAQSYPSKPVRMIVPIAPGGGQDFVARLVGQKLTSALGQQVLVDNRPGAGGTIGTNLAAKAAPDGYTLVVVAASYAAQPSLYSKLPYDPLKDLAPVTQLGGQPYLLVIHPSVPARTVNEFVALARSRTGKVTYGSTGNGEMSHLSMELLRSMARFDAVHVPYKGAAPALGGLVSGEVDAFFPSITSGMVQVRAGKARLLGVTTIKRAPLLPDVPTLAESGFAGYDVSGWYGLLAPAGTPGEIIARLHQEVSRILNLPDVREAQAANGRIPAPGGNTPQEFAANIKVEVSRWSRVISQAGIRLE